MGVTSYERHQLARLTVNQQTGQISGDGPGVLRSTRFGKGLTSLASPQLGSSSVPGDGLSTTAAAAGSKLNFLRIDFQQGIAGKLTCELTFLGRVRTAYGPVDSWEQELDTNRPESLPPESVRLSCEELRVHEDPIAARAAAHRGVDIEHQHPAAWASAASGTAQRAARRHFGRAVASSAPRPTVPVTTSRRDRSFSRATCGLPPLLVRRATRAPTCGSQDQLRPLHRRLKG